VFIPPPPSFFSSKYLVYRESTRTISGSEREAPFALNGPKIPFSVSQPSRITYYTKLDSVMGESQKSNFGTLFSLLSGGKNIIGVYVGDKIKQGANFGTAVDERGSYDTIL